MTAVPGSIEPAAPDPNENLRDIFALIRKATGGDFTLYRHNTIQRRNSGLRHSIVLSSWHDGCSSTAREGEVNGMRSESRLFTMFAGWIIAFYGVRRRSWLGTAIAILGLGVAQKAMTVGEGERQ